MKKISYSTKQGSLILNCFEKSEGQHLTIEQISQFLSEKGTPVGTATIYRHVQKLVDEGKVRKFSADSSDKACFQFVTENDCKMHFHLKCTRCGKLFHSSCPYIDNLSKHIFSHHNFTIDNSRTIFYGVCSQCAKNN